MTSSEAQELAHVLLASAEGAQRCRTEETVISMLDLPTGRQWVFLEDCNVLALSPRLDEAGRERAIAEARRECDLRRLGNQDEQQRFRLESPGRGGCVV